MLYDSRQTRKTKIFKVFTCSGVFSLPLHNWFENMPGQKILASTIAMTFRDEIKNKLGALESDQTPLLVGILANNDPAAKAYAEWTRRACEADHIRYELRVVDDTLLVEAELKKANQDPKVTGIIIYYPIFGTTQSYSGSSQDDYLRDSIAKEKDVEGLCHLYRTSLYRNVRFVDHHSANPKYKMLLPCTALSCVKILEAINAYDTSVVVGRRMHGKIATIINRSEIVGRPLAAMLANDGAKVYSVDVDSIYLFENGRISLVEDMDVETCVRMSDVVVTGVPVKAYKLNTSWIKPNTFVVNVASFKNVDEEELLKIDGVKYVAQVGKVTVAMLERNLLRLHKQYHSINSHKSMKESLSEVARDLQHLKFLAGAGVVLGVGNLLLSIRKKF